MAEPTSSALPAVPVRLTSAQLAQRLGISEGRLRSRRVEGRPPAFLKSGPGRNSRVLYELTTIEAFEAEHRFLSTTEAAEAHRAAGGGAP